MESCPTQPVLPLVGLAAEKSSATGIDSRQSYFPYFPSSPPRRSGGHAGQRGGKPVQFTP
ncbi:MAG: hypothetical protein ACQESR_09240 [Planctomycetota bacterium]